MTREKRPQNWSEIECYFAVWAYDCIDLDRKRNKAALYREVSELIGRSVNSVEFKVQNVSACDPRPREDKPISEAVHKQGLLQIVFDQYWCNREQARAREQEMRRIVMQGGAGATQILGVGSGIDSPPTAVEPLPRPEHLEHAALRAKSPVEDAGSLLRGRVPDGRLRCLVCGFVTPQRLASKFEIVRFYRSKVPHTSCRESFAVPIEVDAVVALCPTCHSVAHAMGGDFDLSATRVLVDEGVAG
jgi:hypothetical protein